MLIYEKEQFRKNIDMAQILTVSPELCFTFQIMFPENQHASELKTWKVYLKELPVSLVCVEFTLRNISFDEICTTQLPIYILESGRLSNSRVLGCHQKQLVFHIVKK